MKPFCRHDVMPEKATPSTMQRFELALENCGAQ